MKVAIVSRELYPYVGGGIAPVVAETARALARIADVTLVTSAKHRPEYEELLAAGDERALRDVRHVWVDEPEEGELGAYFSFMHHYSARAFQALREAFPERGPDLIEFCDYLGEGVVTVQARHTRDPWLDDTTVCVRLHTTTEICAVLDGNVPDDFETMAVHEAERYCLKHCDHVLWSGGDILGTYHRFYGEDAIASPVRLPHAFLVEGTLPDVHASAPEPAEAAEDAAEGDAPTQGPLRLLYLGRFERRKGVQNLIRAVLSSTVPDIELTLLGGDTNTGPSQTSLRHQLELMAADDRRIHFAEPVPRHEVASFIRAADVVVMPSLWECWPNVGHESLMHGRPLLGTPVGGLQEMVQAGRSGWLADGTSAEALRVAIERLAGQRDEIGALIASGTPREVFAELTDEELLLERYGRLVAEPPAVPRPLRPRREPPLVSVVVPYFKIEEHVEETLRSALAQTHPRLEVVVVNDGSLRDEDRMLYELAGELPFRLVTQPNSGLSAARNTGVAVARGEYVLPLDADDLIEPEFVERCLRGLEQDRDLAYVTTWVEYMDPDGETVSDDNSGYMPWGNWSSLIERNNVGGTCSAVIRRRVFERGLKYSVDLTSFEDWMLYQEMARHGLRGAVIPERLFRYRVRPESMMRTDGARRMQLIVGEMRAQLREREMQWTATTA